MAPEDPSRASAQSTVTLALLAANRFRDAVQNALQVVDRDPNLGYARVTLAMALLALYRPTEALQEMEKARGLDRSGMNETFFLHAMARALGAVERYPEAERVLREALAIDDLPDLHILLAFTLGSMNRREEAVKLLMELSAKHPNDDLILSSLSDELRRSGKLQDAEDAAIQALGLNPDSIDARTALGWLALGRGDPAGALEQFDMAHRMSPEDLGQTANRGAALSALGRHAEARTVLDEVAKAAPDFFTYFADDVREYVERSRAAAGNEAAKS